VNFDVRVIADYLDTGRTPGGISVTMLLGMSGALIDGVRIITRCEIDALDPMGESVPDSRGESDDGGRDRFSITNSKKALAQQC
jgi:hypothetical protein